MLPMQINRFDQGPLMNRAHIQFIYLILHLAKNLHSLFSRYILRKHRLTLLEKNN